MLRAGVVPPPRRRQHPRLEPTWQGEATERGRQPNVALGLDVTDIGRDVIRIDGTAVRATNQPSADRVPAYVATYVERIGAIFGTPEQFAEAFSEAIIITPAGSTAETTVLAQFAVLRRATRAATPRPCLRPAACCVASSRLRLPGTRTELGAVFDSSWQRKRPDRRVSDCRLVQEVLERPAHHCVAFVRSRDALQSEPQQQ